MANEGNEYNWYDEAPVDFRYPWKGLNIPWTSSPFVSQSKKNIKAIEMVEYVCCCHVEVKVQLQNLNLVRSQYQPNHSN